MYPRVLLVDNDQDVLDVLARMLHSLGINATLATDGGEAINIIKREKFDLIIANLIMPGKGGLEILQEVKTEALEISVIITAGVDLNDPKIDLLNEYDCDFLHKPFTIADVSEKINKCLAKIHNRGIRPLCRR